MNFNTANPFSGGDIYVRKDQHEAYKRYSATGSEKDIDRAPFPRQVDMWWVGLCIGLRADQRLPLGDDPVKMIAGTIFGSDAWRITHLGLIGLTVDGGRAQERPAELLRIAAEYAAYGSAQLIDVMASHVHPMKPLLAWLRELDGSG